MAHRPATPFQARGELITPGAPRFGSFEDDWTPAGQTRKSPRSSVQRIQRNAAPATPAPTPISKRAPRSSLGDNRQALSEERTSSSASSPHISHIQSRRTPGRMASKLPTPTESKKSMLPTPAKTPKRAAEKPTAELASISRTLFDVRPDSVDETFPAPKKARGKFSKGLNDNEEAPIKIFTDSKERVPELDLHPDNVFLDRPDFSGPAKTQKKRVAMVNVHGEGQIPLEEAIGRSDGTVFSFRGKYVFKFLSESQEDAEPAGAMIAPTITAQADAAVPARLRGPLTRSSLKPRMLFPTADQLAVREKTRAIADEEAVTEEEASTDVEEKADMVRTPTRGKGDSIVTPSAPKFGALASPPTTVRATRSSHKAYEVLPSDSPPDVTMGGDGAGDERSANNQSESLSPFSAWRRTKARYGTPQHKKRTGEELKKNTAQASKRHRRGSRGSGRAEAA